MVAGADDTLELHFTTPPRIVELLIAELDSIGCEGFLEGDGTLKAYIPASNWDAGKATVIREWLRRQDVEPVWKEERIEAQDWNGPWERSIKPVLAPPFYVRPSWVPPPANEPALIDIVIDPKMSFGTGHHESTRLILKSLPDLIAPTDHVLDAGAGTGILSIAAVKLGAARVTAFDIDPWAAENAAENIARNGVDSRISFFEGSLEAVNGTEFDVILANINRQVLLGYMSAFSERLGRGGRLMLAGLLLKDRADMLTAAAGHGFTLVGECEEGEWWSGRFTKS